MNNLLIIKSSAVLDSVPCNVFQFVKLNNKSCIHWKLTLVAVTCLSRENKLSTLALLNSFQLSRINYVNKLCNGSLVNMRRKVIPMLHDI